MEFASPLQQVPTARLVSIIRSNMRPATADIHPPEYLHLRFLNLNAADTSTVMTRLMHESSTQHRLTAWNTTCPPLSTGPHALATERAPSPKRVRITATRADDRQLGGWIGLLATEYVVAGMSNDMDAVVRGQDGLVGLLAALPRMGWEVCLGETADVHILALTPNDKARWWRLVEPGLLLVRGVSRALEDVHCVLCVTEGLGGWEIEQDRAVIVAEPVAEAVPVVTIVGVEGAEVWDQLRGWRVVRLSGEGGARNHRLHVARELQLRCCWKRGV